MLLYSFDSDINLFHLQFTFFIDFLCPKVCTVLKKYRDGKGFMKKLSEQKNEGRKGLRRHLEESSWISPYFSISTSTLVLSLYCHHVSESVNCSTSFKLLHVTLGWTSIWYWYYNIWHCSTTLVTLSDCHGSEEVIHCTHERKRKHTQMLWWKNACFWAHICKWTHQSFAHFAQFCTWTHKVFYMEFHRRKSMGCSKTSNQMKWNRKPHPKYWFWLCSSYWRS